jgi:hypothetical protein
MPHSARWSGWGGGAPLPCPHVAISAGQAQVAALERQLWSIAWALDVMHRPRLAVIRWQRLVDPLEAEAAVRLGCEHLRLDATPRCTPPAEVLGIATGRHGSPVAGGVPLGVKGAASRVVAPCPVRVLLGVAVVVPARREREERPAAVARAPSPTDETADAVDHRLSRREGHGGRGHVRAPSRGPTRHLVIADCYRRLRSREEPSGCHGSHDGDLPLQSMRLRHIERQSSHSLYYHNVHPACKHQHCNRSDGSWSRTH